MSDTVKEAQLVRGIINRKFADCGVAVDDLMQEGMLAILRARQTYDPGMGVKFDTYANVVVHNHLVDVVRKYNFRIDNELPEINEVWANPKGANRDEVSMQGLLDIMREVFRSCTPLERKIFNLRVREYTYQEISDQLQVDRKKIDNTIQKIRKLVKIKDGN